MRSSCGYGKLASGAYAAMSMSFAGAVSVLLLVAPCFHAASEGMEEGSMLGTEEFLVQRTHQTLVTCDGIHGELDHVENSNNQQSMKNMEDCITAIASFAERTRSQREKSLEANKNYAEDMALARRVLMHLTEQTSSRESDFKDFKMREQQRQHLKHVQGMIDEVQEIQPGSFFQTNELNTGVLAQDHWRLENSDSYAASGMVQAPMVAQIGQEPMALMMAPMVASMAQAQMQAPMMAPIVRAPLMASMMQASVLTPKTQQPHAPQGLVGRRPSFLQNAAPGVGGVQEQLNIEAEKLQKRNALEMQGGDVSGTDSA
jgi:hypothetical protein